jgi:hypothetical protein
MLKSLEGNGPRLRPRRKCAAPAERAAASWQSHDTADSARERKKRER